MQSLLEITAAALLLMLAILAMVMWDQLAPQAWAELDLRVALVAMGGAWLAIIWGIGGSRETLIDPGAP